MIDYGLTLKGLTQGAGTSYELESLQGLGGQAPRTSDLPDDINGGIVPARDSRPQKILTCTWEIKGTPGTDLFNKLAAFAAAWKIATNTIVPITFHVEGAPSDRHLNGFSRGWDFTLDQPASMGAVRVVSQFCAPDGLIYDASNAVVDF